MGKKILLGLGALIVLAIVGVGAYVGVQVAAFERSIAQVRDLPIPDLKRSTEPQVVARGRHVSDALGACSVRDCHGSDLGGGRSLDAGPLGVFAAPNVTLIAQAYTDGELARLLRHGVKKDGRSVRFMPVQDFAWLPDSDLLALVSYIRSLPVVDRPAGVMKLGVLAKVLDRRGLFIADVARRLVDTKPDLAPAPAPTAAYGRYVGRLCTGCHGETLSGGRIPGAPASFAIPLNLTPDQSGLKDWTFEDFERLMVKGLRKNGKPLDPLMPIEALARMDDVEKHALYSYLMSLPPIPFGNR